MFRPPAYEEVDSRRDPRRRWSPVGGRVLAAVAGVGLSLLVQRPGATQTSLSPPQAPVTTAPAPPEPAPPAAQPGLVDELQKLLPAPLQGWPTLDSPQQTIDNLNQRARDAGDNLSRLSKQQLVSGRVKCPLAGNGAPDCKQAANKLCADNGFKEGQSIDSDSAESCPASVLLSDKPPVATSCPVENFVIRALCRR